MLKIAVTAPKNHDYTDKNFIGEEIILKEPSPKKRFAVEINVARPSTIIDTPQSKDTGRLLSDQTQINYTSWDKMKILAMKSNYHS